MVGKSPAAAAPRILLLLAAAMLVPACAPPPPVLEAVLASVSRVDLSWTSVDVSRFTVERGTDGVAFSVIATLPGTARSYSDTTAAGGTTYQYRLGGWYDEVAHSNVVTVTTPWAASYGGAGDEDFLALCPAGDGGFVAAGEIDPLGTWQWDAWLVRMGPSGAILWQKSLGTGLGEWVDHIVPASDGGFLVVGECNWSPGDGDGWVARLSASGSVEWQYSLGGTGYDELLGAARAPDGGFILSGYTYSSGAGGSDLWVVKLAANGALEWQRTYGGPDYEGASYTLQVRPTSDGGYAVVSAGGSSDPYEGGGCDLWVLKLTSRGDVDWARSYGGPGDDLGFCVAEARNGDLLVAGTTTSFGSGGTDFWILRLNSRGNPAWQRTFGGPGEDYAYWIEEASNREILVVGTTGASFGAGDTDYWGLRLRADGGVIWQKTYGGPDHDWVYAMQGRETPDGGLAVAGSTPSGGADGWVLKLARDGTIAFNPASSYRAADTSAAPVDTRVRPRRLRIEVGIPDFLLVPYGAAAEDTDLGFTRQAP